MPRAAKSEPSPRPVAPLEPELFRKALRSWYRKHARTLPWRGIHDPYATWLSEIMLQQTRVATVVERYGQFLTRFPTIADLAAAPEDDVLALWSGLGYYRRARMLHRGAQFVVRELNGALPRTAADLRSLPGVGEYTAAAIASIAFGERIAVLDGNVERVLLRVLGLPEQKTAAARSTLLQTANDLVPPVPQRPVHNNPAGDHNQAMMELGATICLPRAPLCLQCPVFDLCSTRGEHPTNTRSPLRSRRVAALLATRKRGVTTEVLLERRAPSASLMPGMLELPPLPLDAVEGREPVLRLRHSITNTNYYVEIFAESAPGTAAQPEPPETGLATHQLAFAAESPDPNAEIDNSERVFEADPPGNGSGRLLASVPAAASDLHWYAIRRLPEQPLTGLARKALQRLGLMSMSPVRLDAKRSV